MGHPLAGLLMRRTVADDGLRAGMAAQRRAGPPIGLMNMGAQHIAQPQVVFAEQGQKELGLSRHRVDHRRFLLLGVCQQVGKGVARGIVKLTKQHRTPSTHQAQHREAQREQAGPAGKRQAQHAVAWQKPVPRTKPALIDHIASIAAV